MNQTLVQGMRDAPEIHNHTVLQQIKDRMEIDRTYTDFGGQGTLTKEELSKDLQYAESVRRLDTPTISIMGFLLH